MDQRDMQNIENYLTTVVPNLARWALNKKDPLFHFS